MIALGRLMTAMITPFHADESLALDAARDVARWLVDQGNEGLVVAGTTGESPTLTTPEKLALFRTVVEAVDGRASVVGNTGGYDTRASVALTREAVHTGISAILAVVPYYNKPTQEGMLRHFSAIAEASELPVIIYNIPGRTGVNMQPATLLELARRHENVVGVKESSGDFAQFSAILRDRRPGFTFWCGDDGLFLPSLAVGGDGVISVAAHLCAREMREMLEAHDAGDFRRASRIHRDLSALFTALFATTSPAPVKWAMNEIGFAAGPLRSPMCEMPEAFAPALRSLIAPYRPRVAAG